MPQNLIAGEWVGKQMELQLEDLEASANEDALAAEKAAARTSAVRSFERKRPSRKPFPEHLARERIVIAAPENCPCCGSAKLWRLGEDITETLEVIPRQWMVILISSFESATKADGIIRCRPKGASTASVQIDVVLAAGRHNIHWMLKWLGR